MSAIIPAPELLLPWESGFEDDRRFLGMLRTALLAFLAIAIAVPLLPVPEVNRDRPRPETPALVRIIPEEKALPEPARTPPKPVEKPPEPAAPVEAVKERPRHEPEPVDPTARARNLAAAAGLLAFRDELSEMRDTVDVNALGRTQLRRGQERAASTERAVITSGLAATSGGIDTSAVSRNTGGPALAGRETTRVGSAIGRTDDQPGTSRPAMAGGRSDESIRRVMDANKGAIFAIYNRALRENPLLQGKLAFDMVIDPSGGVAQLTLVSSDLSDAALTRKILARIRSIDFGAEQVAATRVHYSLDFLPFS